MSKITFDNDSLYIIETNKGHIGIDVTDLSNVARVEEMYNEFENIHREFKARQLNIDKQNNLEKNKFGMTIKERDTLDNIETFLNKSAKVIDKLFGKGASEKVFYEPLLDRALITVPRLELFLNELLPKELEKAGLKQEQYLKNKTSRENREKFLDKDEDIKKVG